MAAQQVSADLHPDGGAAGQCSPASRWRRSSSVLACIPMAAQQVSADLHPDGGAAGQC
jgi:hypothetical protein